MLGKRHQQHQHNINFMKYNLQSVTVQYLKNTETNEETFFRGTSEFELSLALNEELSTNIEKGLLQIVEKTEEHFVEEVTGHVVPYNQYYKVRKYDSYHGQLDMLWHDINNGLFGDNAKTGEWYQYIKSIKDQHPKP